MARPRNDAAGPSARERLLLALWDLLERKPYDEITIKELSAQARVNHNTFYYHFANIDELAREAVVASVPKELFGAVTLGLAGGQMDLTEIGGHTGLEEPYRRVRLLATSGSYALQDMAREVVVTYWLGRLGIDPDALSENDRARIAFVWGGVIALIGCDRMATFEHYRRALAEGGVADAIVELLRRVVEGHDATAAAQQDEEDG